LVALIAQAVGDTCGDAFVVFNDEDVHFCRLER
jgi:hypothetical protein